jgi:protein involved in sex pheromone biosynthesis
MLTKTLTALAVTSSLYLTGCASVPMATPDEDAQRKTFAAPSDDKAGLYIYRNSIIGGALKKTISIDGKVIGESAAKTYFYKELTPGSHDVATESEFSDNKLTIQLKKGINYFVRQYIKMGAFVGGAGVEQVTEEVGKKGVLESKLAKENPLVGKPSQ